MHLYAAQKLASTMTAFLSFFPICVFFPNLCVVLFCLQNYHIEKHDHVFLLYRCIQDNLDAGVLVVPTNALPRLFVTIQKFFCLQKISDLGEYFPTLFDALSNLSDQYFLPIHIFPNILSYLEHVLHNILLLSFS